MNADSRILEPGQLEGPRGEIRFLFLPQRDLFSRRAGRLRHLSKGNSLGDYLEFLALLADAQQDALDLFPEQSLPDFNELTGRSTEGKPLLDARTWQRHPAWRAGLLMMLEKLSRSVLTPAAREAVSGLLRADDASGEDAADRILAGDLATVSPQELPFIAAALQVYWVHLASSLREDSFGRREQGGLCPVCGSRPTAGIVRSNGAEQGLRYLSCSLCVSEWHMVRLTCSSCETTEGIDYYTLDGSNGSIKMERCGSCCSYLKLMYLSKDSGMESMADDLATLPLDMLMDREGGVRRGPNLFFHPGRSY